MKSLLLFTLMTLLISGCVPKKGEETVEVLTDGIFNPVNFEIVGGTDLGEILTGDDPVIVTLRVKNNSKFDLTEVDLVLDTNSTAGMTFALTEDGVDGYPGSNGTCKTTVAPGEECTILIAFNPSRSGTFTQEGKFTYKNFVDKVDLPFSFKMFAGEAASLVFTDDVSTFDFGILEQTEPIVRTQSMIIENRGGLSARDLDIAFASENDPSGFYLESHNCPTQLKQFEQCTATMAYVPRNNLEADPEEDYSGILSFNYIKDGKTATGALNAFFSYKSAKIEGQIDANVLAIQWTPDIIVGNKESQIVKVSNKGYKEAILKKLHFNSGATPIAYCQKAVSGDVLDCFNPDDTPATLEDFPFKIQDQTGCMDVEINGSTITNPFGDSCIFPVTFWPSVAYTSDMDFTGYKITWEYDSTWKNVETIRNIELHEFFANSLAAGKLEFVFTRLDGVDLIDNDATDNWFSDMGRQALITDPAYKIPFQIRLINTGSSPVIISQIYDSQTPAQQITGASAAIMNMDTTNPPFVVPAGTLETYWVDANSDCAILNPTDICHINMNFLPLHYSNEPMQNRLFLDVDPEGTPGPNRYKAFFVEYQDGSTFNDDDTPRADRQLESRYTGVLVTKGYLVFQDPSPTAGDMGIHPSGHIEYHRMVLENVGTGSVTYIKIDDADNVTDPWYSFPFDILDDPDGTQGGAADHDCIDITDFTSTGSPPFPLNDLGDLAPGETCSFYIRAQTRQNHVMDEDDYVLGGGSVFEEERPSFVADDNTNALYKIRGIQGLQGQTTTRFQYYDGDLLLSDPPPYDPDYGFFLETPDYDITVRFEDVAELNVEDPRPYTSGVLYRPPLTYPTMIDGSNTVNGYSIPATWFFDPSSVHPDASQVVSQNHAVSVVDNSYDWTYHMGSFPVVDLGGAVYQPYTGSFDITNMGNRPAVITSWTNTSPIPEFVWGGWSTNSPLDVWNSETMSFTFTPTSAGTYETFVDVQYNDGLNPRTHVYRVVAEAYEAATHVTDFTIEEEVWDVTYDPMIPATNEVLSGTRTAVDIRTNDVDPGYQTLFDAVKTSAVYAKKRYYIRNTSAHTISGVNISIRGSILAQLSSNISNGYELIYPGGCDNLAPLAECFFDVKFTALSSSPATMTRYLHVTYAIQSDQYVAKVFQMDFAAADPADLSVLANSTLQILGDDGYTYSSYPVNYGFYLDTIHIRVTSYPHPSLVNGVQVVNNSLLKASFLKMNETPPAFPAEPVEIYNANNIKVFATRACFYGDDEFDGGVPADEKGFNSLTFAPCLLDFQYDADEEYLGDVLVNGENLVHLDFYNNKRSSYDTIHFHLDGFVEPNFSTALASYYDVEAFSNGAVQFKWGVFTPDDIAWGPVTGYRIFYTDTEFLLADLYTTAVDYVDVDSSTTDVTITGLFAGRYYYFKVAALREIGAGPTTYISVDESLPTLKVVVPTSDAYYVHDLAGQSVLVDRALTSGFGLKADAISACLGELYLLTDGGSSAPVVKQLINTDVVTWLKSDPDPGYATYSDYNIEAVPHWLADPKTDIEPIFDPYGFDPAATTQYVPGPELLYQKPCGDNSCNMLDKIYGGDGVDLPFDATLYIMDDAGAGAFRCWAPI